MPLNPALKQLIETKLAHTHTPQWELPIAEVRQAFGNLWTPAITGEPVPLRRIQDIAIPATDTRIPARIYAPDDAKPCPIMLYFHGGGYVKGGIEESDAFCRNLARVARHVVVSIDYRLAPEHAFPAALDDAVAATVWAGTHASDIGGKPGAVVVCGESAGGNLAAVTCLSLRADARVSIRYQVLLQPVVDFTLSFPSIAMAPTECLVPRDDLAWYYRTYCSERCDARDPRVSPIFAEDLSGLPPALIIAAEYDTLRDEAQAYAERLKAAGVQTHYVCARGMVHGFLQMRGLVADAQTATEEIARALN
ncbi:MAG TPA: alpha/beta hydrolase [Casimicrobiaceae bacterium]|nr:alpha/beta hydrolase [Casimicrobiaceae bacterium]